MELKQSANIHIGSGGGCGGGSHGHGQMFATATAAADFIARELHDVVAHHIAVINVQSGVARHLIESDPEGASEALTHVREASGVVLSEMSTILGLLRTSDDTVADQPAPGLAQVDALVDSVRRSGTTPVTQAWGPCWLTANGTTTGADMPFMRSWRVSMSLMV